MNLSRFAFLLAAGISLFGALIHWVAPAMDPDWYAFLTSPAWVVESARNHTWSAPIGGMAIGGLMFMCALYAFAGMGRIKKLPLMRTALCIITSVCLVRGLLLIPFLVRVPERLTAFDIVASLVWLIAGIAFLSGTIGSWSQLKPASLTEPGIAKI